MTTVRTVHRSGSKITIIRIRSDMAGQVVHVYRPGRGSLRRLTNTLNRLSTVHHRNCCVTLYPDGWSFTHLKRRREPTA